MKLWPFSKKDKAGGGSIAATLPPGVVLAAPEEADHDPLTAPNVESHYEPVLSDPAPVQEAPPPLPTANASAVYLFGDPTEADTSLSQTAASSPEAFFPDTQFAGPHSADALLPPVTPEHQTLDTFTTQDLADTLNLLTPPASEQVNMSGFAAAWTDAEPLGDTDTLNSSEMPPMDFFATNTEYIMPTEAVPLSPPEEFTTPLRSSSLPMDESINLEADPMSWLDNPAERGGHAQSENAAESAPLLNFAPQGSESELELFATYEAADTSVETPASVWTAAPDDADVPSEAIGARLYELSPEPAAPASTTDLYGLGGFAEPMPASTMSSFEILTEPDEAGPEAPIQGFEPCQTLPETDTTTNLAPITTMCFDTDEALETMTSPAALSARHAFAVEDEELVVSIDSGLVDTPQLDTDAEESFLFVPEFDPKNESLLADLPTDNDDEEDMFYSQRDLDLADPPADMASYDLGHYDDPNDLHDVINLDVAASSQDVHFLLEREHDSAVALEEVPHAEADPFYSFYDPAPEAPAVAEPTLSGVEFHEATASSSPESAEWDLEPPPEAAPALISEPIFNEQPAALEIIAPVALPSLASQQAAVEVVTPIAEMDMPQPPVEEPIASLAEPLRQTLLQPLLPESVPPARQAIYPQSAFDFQAKQLAVKPRSVAEALDDFEQQILLEDSRFLKKSIDDLVSRYFAQKDREEKAW